MNHTKEPWEVASDLPVYGIWSNGENKRVVQTTNQNNHGTYGKSVSGLGIEKSEDAERICACVNACADVEDDCLEQGYVKWLQQRTVELELSVMNLEEEIARMKTMNKHLVTNGEWEDI